MKLFKDMKIRTRIILLIAFPLIIFILISGYAIFTMQLIASEIHEISTEDLPLIEHITNLTHNKLSQASMFEKIVRYEKTGQHDNFTTAKKKFDTDDTSIAKSITNSIAKAKEAESISKGKAKKEFGEILTKFEKIEKSYKKYVKDARKLFNSLENKFEEKKKSENKSEKDTDYQSANKRLTKSQLIQNTIKYKAIIKRLEQKETNRENSEQDEIDKIEKEIDKIEKEEEIIIKNSKTLLREIRTFTTTSIGDTEKHEETGLIILIVICSVGIVINILFSIVIVGGITGPLLDVSQKIISSSDELNEASQSLSTGTEELSQQSVSISSSSNQMSQNLTIVASSVEQMSMSIGEVTKQAVEAAKVAEEANSTSANTNNLVKELGDNASEVGIVTEAIAEIADQTNLLALNAAIEAAGAGDAGKGFAVVASEVKELARKVSESADDIKKRIIRIQDNTKLTVEAIENISTVISQLNEINTMIATAMEQQSITTKEIASNVTQAATGANEVTKNIEGVSIVAKDGAQSAEKLFTLVKELETLSTNLANNLQNISS